MTVQASPAVGSVATPARSRIGLIIALAMISLYAFAGLYVARHTEHGLAPGGAPMFYDFSAFYEAGAFADHGQAARAYDDHAMGHAIAAAFPGTQTRLPWNYPPTLQMLFMPLAALPYPLAWLIWSAALYGFYACVASRLFAREYLWLALALPAAAVNILVGQNGLLTAGLMGGGVLLLDKRPWLAGALFGLLTYKPHFAVLAPVLLIATRQWRALAGAAVAAAAVALVSLILFGPAPWLAFVHKALAPSGVLSSSTSDWRTVPSVQIMARTLGATPFIASVLHWSVAALSAGGAVFVWRRTRDTRLRAAALGAAALLVTPYLRVYDLAVAALPLASLASPAPGRKPSPAENALVIAAWLAPAILLFTASPIQVAPVITVALMILTVRRAMPGSAQAAPPAPVLAQARPAP